MAFVDQSTINQQKEEAQQQPGATTNAPAPTATAAASPVQTAQPQRQGSGRFTNIQKLIGANQGAGERLAGGIGRKVEANVNPKAEQARTQADSVRAGIEAAQNKLGQGQNLRQQVSDQNFDVVGFAAQQPNVQNFTDFRTRGAINEQELGNQINAARNQATQAQQQVNQFNQQLGSELGRQQLLKQTFSPTRNYTVGQQRLDNLFLAKASPQIQNIQNNLTGKSQDLTQLLNENKVKQDTLGNIVKDEDTLAKDLTNIMGGKESDLVSAAEARANEVNSARQAAQEAARTQFQNLVDGKEITGDFASLVNLNDQDRLFNLIRDQGNMNDYLKFNETLLQGANQLATQDQRQKYDAVARLAGITPEQMRIKQQSDARDAVESTGELRKRLDSRQQNFGTLSNETKYGGATGDGSDIGTASLQNLIPSLESFQQPDIDWMKNLGGWTVNPTTRFGNLLNYRIAPANAQEARVRDLIYNTVNQSDLVTSNPFGPYNYSTTAANATRQALIDAYSRLADEGYFQDVKIANPTLRTLPKVE